MTREEVYDSISTERDYQNQSIGKPNSYIVQDFPLGSALSAIRQKLDIAQTKWYSETEPYPEAMEEIRKIAAICVQMGERYGMSPKPVDAYSLGF